MDCGFQGPALLYDFHHRDPRYKEFSMCMGNMLLKWERLLNEAMKCDLLCPMCHRLRHADIDHTHIIHNYWEDN